MQGLAEILIVELPEVKHRYDIESRLQGEKDWIPLIEATTFQDALDQIRVFKEMDAMEPSQVYAYRVYDRLEGRYCHLLPPEATNPRLTLVANPNPKARIKSRLKEV